MYRRILVPLEHTGTDATIVDHVRGLARFAGASVILMHVADGWAARNIRHLDLRESEEMKEDRAYLERLAADFNKDGLKAEALLATGDPAAEIALAAEREHCDLIAMATHGHKLIGDVVYGSVANAVRHKTMVPVLLVRSPVDVQKQAAP
ncbi:MAG: universal stress protein [Gemmatimonadaceae bacterium]